MGPSGSYAATADLTPRMHAMLAETAAWLERNCRDLRCRGAAENGRMIDLRFRLMELLGEIEDAQQTPTES